MRGLPHHHHQMPPHQCIELYARPSLDLIQTKPSTSYPPRVFMVAIHCTSYLACFFISRVRGQSHSGQAPLTPPGGTPLGGSQAVPAPRGQRASALPQAHYPSHHSPRPSVRTQSLRSIVSVLANRSAVCSRSSRCSAAFQVQKASSLLPSPITST